MAIRHSTPADDSFTTAGATAWNADHTGDASDLSFLQSGTGAVSRTVQAKERDIIALADFDTSGHYDTAKALQSGTLALPFTEFIKPGVGLPQIKLWGTAARYATFRCTGDGSDDGDLIVNQTGSTVWMQSLTNPYRLTLLLSPKGTVLSGAPSTLELFGTDRVADSTNWERLYLGTMQVGNAYHEILSDKSGTGTVRPIHMYLSGIANGIYLNSDANNGVGTLTPRRKWDILDASNPQLRLTQADNSKYVDFNCDSSGVLTIKPNGTTQLTIGATGIITVANGTITTTGANNLVLTATSGGSVYCNTAGGSQLEVYETASVANRVQITGAASGANASITVSGENLLFGSGSAIATTATAGYVMFPSCAGTPTGVPTAQGAGKIPMIFDTTGVKLWFYTGGAWKGVVVA
jgi:hypothetical protein